MTRDTANIAASMQRILKCLRQRAGLSFRPAQLEQMTAAVARAMQRTGEATPSRYVERLETELATLDDLIAELVVGETYFFRIPEHFEFIRETFSSVRQRLGTARPMRVWSAGCATGEEPYSLAILFLEMGVLDHTHLIATDISRLALERARQGRYREWSFRGAAAPRAKRHVTFTNDAYLLDEKLRRAVHFSYLNLALDVYPSFVTGTRDLDWILCRNVLIYLDHDTVGRVARRLYQCLTPGGWLIAAASDPSLETLAPFETVHARSGVYYRRPVTEVAAMTGRAAMEGMADREIADDRGIQTAAASSDAVHRASPAAQPSTVKSVAAPSLEEIRNSLLAGDYERVVALTQSQLDSPAACVLHVQALSNDDTSRAEHVCRQLLERHNLSAELNYLHAVLLMERRRPEEALAAIRKVLYLDRTLAIAYFTLGTLARRMGNNHLARRAFRNARDVCRQHPDNEIVRFTEDETYLSLSRAAAAQLSSLGEPAGGPE